MKATTKSADKDAHGQELRECIICGKKYPLFKGEYIHGPQITSEICDMCKMREFEGKK